MGTAPPRNQPGKFQHAYFFLGKLASIQTPDKYTIVFKTKEPYAPFLNYIASPWTVIVAREVVEKHGDLQRHAIGTGPFIMQEYRREQEAVFVKNPNYFRKGLPYLDEVRLQYVIDPVAATAAFRARPTPDLLWPLARAGGEAPAYVCWGHNNRSALIRVPMYKPQKGNSTRVEFRSVDAACNPYLAFAVILAAGLKGIEGDYELPPGAEDDVWALTSAERRALGIRPLPQDLDQAIRVMQDSDLVAETLGEHVFDFFLRNKRAEWQEYRRQVTEYELGRYLPML